MLLDTPCFIGRTPAMFPRLIDHCSGQQLCRVELADRETFEPGFVTTREAIKLRPAHVPELDVDAVRAALADSRTATLRV
jgi:hypothetical protein